jgi:hypothetical protein
MSIMFMKVRSVSRGSGGSAVAKAAYIARERLHDARAGVVHDYRKTPGLAHQEILLPADAPAAARSWAGERGSLWNAAESAERARNARVAREFTVALPHELPGAQRVALARDFAQRIADRYGAAVDLAVHGPTPRGDPRNHHAHILATTREVRADGLAAKASIELNNTARHARGLPHIEQEFRMLRAEWAGLANERLRAAELETRLEPRSRATILREQHAAREALQASAIAAPAPAPPAPGSVTLAAVPPGAERPAPTVPPPERALTLEDVRQRAVQRWLAYRAAPPAERDRSAAAERALDRQADAGLEL